VRYLALMRRALTLTLIAALAACEAPAFHGVALDPPEPAAALQLADSAGAVFDLAQQRGKVVLVFFGYTHCPDVCPTTMVDWRKATDSLGAKASGATFVFVSVDPERDTPALAQRYAARFSPGFLGLTGTRPQIDSLLARWKLSAFRDGVPGDTAASYTVSHPSQVFVIDREGQLRLLQQAGLTPAQIAADIEALL
jgi:protein SCO1